MNAGVAKTDITPEPAAGAFMTGYTSSCDMPAEGVHDPLFARVLVLDDGQRKVAVVALDLIGLNPGRLPKLARVLGIDGLLLVSTHTHGGPLVLDLGTPYGEDRSWPQDAAYLTWLEERVAGTIGKALGTCAPVRMSLGRGSVDIGFNRRQVIDGEVQMVWGQNRDRAHEWGPVDPEVAVWRLDTADGDPLAVLVNHACHPVVMGGKNRLLTADFPGAAMDCLQRSLSGAMPFFLQGCCGDIDPYVDVQEDFRAVRDQGEELARSVEAIYHAIGPEDDLDVEGGIDWREQQLTFARFADEERRQELAFGVLRVGRDLAFATLPGEPFVELQLDLKRRSPVRHTFMLGYTNGYAGYFPTPQANREGGYGASYGKTMHVEPGAGKAMVEAILQMLRQTSG